MGNEKLEGADKDVQLYTFMNILAVTKKEVNQALKFGMN